LALTLLRLAAQTRFRTITQQPSLGGAACPSLIDKQPCELRKCGNYQSEGVVFLTWLSGIILLLEVLVGLALILPLPKGYRKKFLTAIGQRTRLPLD
jgi:hypothetical protein